MGNHSHQSTTHAETSAKVTLEGDQPTQVETGRDGGRAALDRLGSPAFSGLSTN